MNFLISLAVLAGGKSGRMGQDKALKLFLGRPLILHVIERLCPLSEDVFIVVNRSERNPLVAVVGCDMPFTCLPLFEYERDIMLKTGVDVVIPSTPHGLEPLHAIYRRETCLPFIKSAMEAGERKIISWFHKVNIHILSSEETEKYTPHYQAFINLNTQEELRHAEQPSGGSRPKLT
ncbi:MAG: molybdenum cofactor guanylyltransferase [Chloroflexi bacterium]|nr:molybdenum cofactor guanylyltransferase [Chloroflexota bacterium]